VFFYVQFTENATENKTKRISIHRFSKQQNNRPNNPTDQQQPTKTNKNQLKTNQNQLKPTKANQN